MKVLFEFDNDSDDVPILKRTELVALFNTLARISDSLAGVQKFRQMIEAEEASDRPELTDRVTKPHNVIPGKDFSEKATEEDFVDNEREELIRLRKQQLPADATISEIFNAELSLMWRVTKYVIKSWFTFPSKLYVHPQFLLRLC